MIAVAFHSANAALRFSETQLPVISDIDLVATEERVRSWSGDIRLYRHFLTQALASRAGESDAASIRAVAVIAAWRSGIVAFRDDALKRATDADPRVVEAALGLDDGTLPAFLLAQRDDPFGGSDAPLIARVGGFRGLGGPWLSPPRDPVVLGAGTCAVRSGSQWWQITADVFGAHVAQLDGEPHAAAGRFGVTTRADSYLVDLERRP